MISEMQAKLSDCDDDDDDELKWISEWTTRLDRGKLVKVSDYFYAHILAMEMKVHQVFFNRITICETAKTETTKRQSYHCKIE